MPRKFAVDSEMKPKDLARRQRNEAQKALRLDDLGRRLAEAKTFIEENQEKYEKDRAAEEAAIRKSEEAAK